MEIKRAFLLFFIILNTLIVFSQNVSVSDDSSYTAHSSAVLDVKSEDKGILIPRVSLLSTTSASPVISPQTSLLVYNQQTANDVRPGYYYWNGNIWVRINSSSNYVIPVSKSSNDTLLITETLVFASNDITLTLPEVTSQQNGLEITIKNNGTCTDLVFIKGNGSSLIDGQPQSHLTRWQANTFVAYEGNWLLKEKMPRVCNILDVSTKSSWTTLDEVIAFLNEHMMKPMVIRLGDEVYEINSTINIDLPYPLTIQGLSFGTTAIVPGAGLSGNPLFRCHSECYFKMLIFDATQAGGFGTNPGEDAIRLVGNDTYNEIKDCTFDGFYNAILDSTNAELWLFECDITGSTANGVLLHSAESGAKLRVSETDFMNCYRGINMEKGSNTIVQLSSGTYLLDDAGAIGINYVPATFSFETMIITNNSWNNTGLFINGFDFSRQDGRDADAFITANAGLESKNPHVKINVLSNTTTTTVSQTGTWYKAVWTNTNQYNCKFAVDNNRITYQSKNTMDLVMNISGNVICTNTNKIFSVAIVKNGNPALRYGETTTKITAASNPYVWATNVYIPDAKQSDYFEIWITSSTNDDVYILQDVQWFTNSH